jgi:hypothetical protein
MKHFTGWVMSAGLVLAAATAHAQGLAPNESGRRLYTAASDVDGPYGAMPPEAATPAPGYGPVLLPPPEVYTVVRENGFSPLGIPQAHGLFYTIAVIDRGGEDGRLVIDARNGRIIRFIPASRWAYGPSGPLPPMNGYRGVPRPPAPVPYMASRTPAVPLPKAPPPRAGEAPRADEVKPQAGRPPAPEPAQQSAAVQAKPADVSPVSPAAAAPVAPKPAAPQIQPTQPMPLVQGLE